MTARKLLNPWTVTIENFGGDAVPASHVWPVMHALVREFKEMRRSNALPATVMKEVHWTELMQILNVRVEGGAAHGEARKVGLLMPHHLVAHLRSRRPGALRLRVRLRAGYVVRASCAAPRISSVFFHNACRVLSPDFFLSQMIANPAGVLPPGSLLALDFVLKKLFFNDADKVRVAHEQFTQYWDEVGILGTVINKFRLDK